VVQTPATPRDSNAELYEGQAPSDAVHAFVAWYTAQTQPQGRILFSDAFLAGYAAAVKAVQS
jgi:hypothetical protein